MRRLCLGLFALVLVASLELLPHPPSAQAQPAPVPGPCNVGLLPSGALSLVCVPSSGWNGDLIVFAHGYVAFNQPLQFANIVLPDGTSLPTLAEELGFAFATTTYRENGLAVLTGADDIRQLVAAFHAAVGSPRHTYMIGGSEGGLVTTLLVEQSPALFNGGLAACGPIGSFRQQINYVGDFRVLFDYFFPGILPGSSVAIPPEVIADWDSVYVPAITQALTANPSAANQLIATSGAAINPSDPSSVVHTALDVLWYDVFATNDAAAKLGGNPYDNHDRWYVGSSNDLLLNLSVPRITADPTALANLAAYETTGNLTIPLVTIHTTGDDIIPFWHEILYAFKARPSGRGSLVQIPSFQYGHCQFASQDLLTAFAVLVYQVEGQALPGQSPATTIQKAKGDFDHAARSAAPVSADGRRGH